MIIKELEAQIQALTAQLQALQSLQDTTITGPGSTYTYQPPKVLQTWDEIKRQEEEDQDPKASALLELRKEVKEEVLLLKKDGEKFKKDLEEYHRNLRRVDSFLITITLVVVVAFITTLSLVFWDMIKEKDLLLNYNNLYQNYSERNIELNNKINEQKIEINNFRNQLDILHAKNPYLK